MYACRTRLDASVMRLLVTASDAARRESQLTKAIVVPTAGLRAISNG
jgi:hypothetical protein